MIHIDATLIDDVNAGKKHGFLIMLDKKRLKSLYKNHSWSLFPFIVPRLHPIAKVSNDFSSIFTKAYRSHWKPSGFLRQYPASTGYIRLEIGFSAIE